jgi:hypothetical protein
VEERLRRGRDVPSKLPLCEGLDPLRAHRHRLERLRDLAVEQGLVATALAAQHTIGRVLDLLDRRAAQAAASAAAVQEVAAPMPAPAPKPAAPRLDILPIVRNLLDRDPEMGPVIRDVLIELGNTPPPAEAAQAAA